MAATTSVGGNPAGVVTEDQARAGFLFQLAQFVQWPAGTFTSDTAPLRFCIYGQDTLASNLELTVRGKVIQGRPIVVVTVHDPAQLQGCQVAFIGPLREKQLRDLFSNWRYPAVLLVGESSQFAEMGGTVNLALARGRVSFEINTMAAERAGLIFRSQLLRFARVVADRPGRRP